MKLPRFRWPVTVALVIGSHLLTLGALELYTLLDDVKGNHITASFRIFLEEQPHMAMLVLLGYIGLLALVVGHVFNNWGGKPPSEER